MIINKNYNRSNYSFANINLLGKCNFDCRWCLGKDLPEFYKFDLLNVHFSEWENFDKFIDNVKEKGVEQIYITGQNTDSLCYKYLGELVRYLKQHGFYVGLRSNGLLAESKMNIINECNTCKGDAVSLTSVSLRKETHKKIVGHDKIPNWKSIIPKIKVPLRIATVIDRYNDVEFIKLLKFFSQFNNIKYFQARRISTDTRQSKFKKDIECYERIHTLVSDVYPKIKDFESAVSYDVFGMEVSFWRTVSTTANSLNYFVNGVISEEYFIIEGYQKNKNKYIKEVGL